MSKSTVAYLHQAERRPIVPLPIGLISHKGVTNDINLNDQAVGD